MKAYYYTEIERNARQTEKYFPLEIRKIIFEMLDFLSIYKNLEDYFTIEEALHINDTKLIITTIIISQPLLTLEELFKCAQMYLVF